MRQTQESRTGPASGEQEPSRQYGEPQSGPPLQPQQEYGGASSSRQPSDTAFGQRGYYGNPEQRPYAPPGPFEGPQQWRGPSPRYQPQGGQQGSGATDYGPGSPWSEEPWGSGGRSGEQSPQSGRWPGFAHQAGLGDHPPPPDESADDRQGPASQGRHGGQRLGTVARERKGPKGYSRSDERIQEAICEELAAAEWLEVSDVSVNVENGEVRLEGTVPERRMKHEVEDIADACWGVRNIENHLRVGRGGAESPALSTPARSSASQSGASQFQSQSFGDASSDAERQPGSGRIGRSS